jgi:tetratricopeptide (TPR) repeat protein
MKRFISALVMVPALALAQPKTPGDWYKEGENQYNLGNFDKAIEAFKKGFELEPDDGKKAAYLFNIAQSYRQANNCKEAQFFYKRYLAFKDNDTKKPLAPDKRKEIEDRIKDLDECAKQQEAIRNKPPDNNLKPDGGDPKPDGGTKPDPKQVGDGTKQPDGGTGNGNGTDGGGDNGGSISAPADAPAKLVSLRLVGGGAKLTTGDLDVPLQATAGLIGGYPLHINPQLSLELGAAFTFTPVPFEDAMMASKSANLIGVLANVGASYKVASKISLRGDVGVGLLLFGGASESPFTDFAETSGTLSMLHVRVGVSADYAFTPNVIGTVAPFAFSYSPAKEGLRADITSITAIDFMVGIGYRM